MTDITTSLLVAIALWCGQPNGIYRTEGQINQCRKKLYDCLKGKFKSEEQAECFLGVKL